MLPFRQGDPYARPEARELTNSLPKDRPVVPRQPDCGEPVVCDRACGRGATSTSCSSLLLLPTPNPNHCLPPSRPLSLPHSRLWCPSQGFLKRLIELMRSMDGIVCENATRVVASVTSYMVANIQLIELGLLPILMSHLDPQKAGDGPDANRGASIYAAIALTNLCDKPEPHAELWRIVPRVLLGVLSCECEYTRCYAASALSNLAMRSKSLRSYLPSWVLSLRLTRSVDVCR